MFILLLFLYWSHVPVHSAEWAIAVKEHAEEYSIALGATTFKDLLKKSTVFVDKSLFIYDILDNPEKSEIILCPQQWGRTMNLDMLRTFLEIQVNSQGRRRPRRLKCPIYRLFTLGEIPPDRHEPVEKLQSPLLISKYASMIEQYQGNYPVIYLSFKDVIGDSFAEVKRRLQQVLSRAFHQHRYLVNVFRRKNNTVAMDKFKENLYPRESTDIASSLNYLCELLTETYQEKVFILIDDHDAPIQSALQNPQMVKSDYGAILDLLETLYKWTFVQNPNLYRGIAVGVFRLGKSLIKSWLEYKLRRVGQSSHPVLDHFGFTEAEVQLLFDKFNITGDLAQQARLWYRGHWSLNLRQQLYHPASMVNFLTHKMLTNVYPEKSALHFLRPLTRNAPSFRTYTMLLLSEQYINITKPPSLDHDRIKALRDAYLGTDRKRTVVIMLSYFLSKGFLIIEPHNFHSSRIPNFEVASEFANIMVSFYRWKYHMDMYWLHKVCIRMYNYVQDGFVLLEGFQEDLENLMKSVVDFELYTKDALQFEKMIRGVFNCIFLQVQGISKYKYRTYYNRLLSADYVIKHEAEEEIAIIVLRANEPNLEDIVEEALSYKHVIYDLPKVKYMKFIGIDVFHNCSVRLISRNKVKVQKKTNPSTKQSEAAPKPTRKFIEED